MKLIISALTILCFGTAGFSQFAIGAGPSMLKAFGVKSPYVGGTIIVEYPIDEQSSYYGRFGLYGKQTGKNVPVNAYALDLTTNPQVMQVNSQLTFNYITIEGGRRFYFGNGYDYGFAPYGGTHLMAAFNQATQKTGDFDRNKYAIDGGEERGSIFNLAFGLSGGVKNDFAWGTLYFDVAFDYFILSKATNNMAIYSYNELGSQVLFTFGLGYKKTIF